MNDFSGFKSEFIDKNAPKHTKDSFKDLLENIHFFYKIAHPQSVAIHTQIPRFVTNYNLYDNKQCDFSTPFKYPNGKNICIGDIVKIESYDKPFIVKFDGAYEVNQGKGGCYLWNGQNHYRFDFDKSKKIEQISNVYIHHISFGEFVENKANETLVKDITPHKIDKKIFYDKNTILKWNYDESAFKLYHNQINEFIQFCKNNDIIESFIKDPLGNKISKNISITLYDSGFGFYGAKVEKTNLNQLITFAKRNDINNQNELLSKIANDKFMNKFAQECADYLEKIEKRSILTLEELQKTTSPEEFKKIIDTRYNEFTQHTLKLGDEIKDYENKFSVLLPDAKVQNYRKIMHNIYKMQDTWKKYKKYFAEKDRSILTDSSTTILNFIRNDKYHTQNKKNHLGR